MEIPSWNWSDAFACNTIPTANETFIDQPTLVVPD